MIKQHDKDYFYKYVTAEVVKKILLTLEVMCQSPLLFNDPFDSQIEIQHDVKDRKEWIERTTGKICKALELYLKNTDAVGVSNLVYSEILKDIPFVADREKAFNRFYTEANEKIIEFAKEDRMFCVTEKHDNLLMWAHYADEHKGAVVKFKCIPEKETALCVALPVKYSDKVPMLTPEQMFQNNDTIIKLILNELLLTKSTDWAYEKEWRVILLEQCSGQDYDLRGILEDEIEAVYLGCRIEEKDKKEIVDIVKTKRKNVKLFQAHKSKKEFKVEFSSVG